MFEIEVAVAKVAQHGSPESGDTFEMIERARGGLSFVLADGRTSGRRAKFVSNLVARKATSLLGDGIREEAAARAANDSLFTYGNGEVSSTLDIVTVDVDARRLVVARNSPVPTVVVRPGGIDLFDEPTELLGLTADTGPALHELVLDGEVYLVVATDGLTRAGSATGQPFHLRREVVHFFEIGGHGAERLADALLDRAVALDGGVPGDDVSVLVVAMRPRAPLDEVRRLVVRLPLGDVPL
jgi:serine phosphatase RsbU (regulator of sigma subunit)